MNQKQLLNLLDTLEFHFRMTVKEYIAEVNRQYQTGHATEHSYRPALQQLLSDMMPQVTVTNEPSRVACGAPDYILTGKDGQPIAFVEAKDIDDSDLDGRKSHKEQFNRYKSSLDTIIFTDYLDFHLYEHGEWTQNVRIGEIHGKKIEILSNQVEAFNGLIAHVAEAQPQKITSASKLAKQMASKARLLAAAIREAFATGDEYDNGQLQGEYEAFKKVLLHDLKTDDFADIYAQTIAYGMFAARLHDKTPETFSREEASTLIPKSNPFLRQIFQHIAGYDLDERIAWIVDDLAATFRATDIVKIMGVYSKDELHNDPMIHFYEDFLSEYDSKLRKSKGVWYTPLPVVRFIVRAVDEILQREFDMPLGLADYSTVTKAIPNVQYSGKKGESKTIQKVFHKVQILDPATGTGTFLAEVINQVYSKFEGKEGMWPSYVEENLIPRLNGFEILMASYAVAHLKLDMLLTNTGYVHTKNERLRVYLTNSLEECDSDTGTLFSQWLSNEANEANYIKRDCPVMVMLGNPPYSGISSNNGTWITNLIEEYKKEPGGRERLKERKIWLNDDYVKFMRLGQMYVDRTNAGIMAYINNNGFIDNPTFRGMRWNLMKSYDRIYILNLHGNSLKKEVAPDGGKDENVFDIMVGTSINIFVKTGEKKINELAEVYYSDLYGEREKKYDYLINSSFSTVPFVKLMPEGPFFFFTPSQNGSKEEYDDGFAINELFVENVMGVTTARDGMVVDTNYDRLYNRIKRFADLSISDDDTRQYFFGTKKSDKYPAGDSRGWNMIKARRDIQAFDHSSIIAPIAYRPFDDQYIYYCQEMVDWPRTGIMQHLQRENMGFCTVRINSRDNEHTYFVTDKIVDKTILSSKDNANVFPLYLYDANGDRHPNLNPETVQRISSIVGYEPAPEVLFDYAYAVLYSRSYRELYKEFLKVDFPRIPYPDNADKFSELSRLGAELRKLHLMEKSSQWPVEVTFPVPGGNVVLGYSWTDDKVFINDTQYFGNVSESAWKFFIGGYQPAQKWLKDRKNVQLSFADIRHYMEIIYALQQTSSIMDEIDSVWRSS